MLRDVLASLETMQRSGDWKGYLLRPNSFARWSARLLEQFKLEIRTT